MPYILNIETATEVCSVSLSRKGETLDLIENSEDKTHSELLTVFIETLMKRNKIGYQDLSAIAVSSGPGSYTGLRIGVSVAKGICYGLKKPLLSVPTLESMAFGGVQLSKEQNSLFCPMIDARRMEVYTSVFDSQLNVVEETNAKIIDSESFVNLLSDNQVCIFGNGAEKCKPIITHPNAIFLDEFNISAQYMSELSYQKFLTQSFEDVAYYEPFYLKEFQAVKSMKKMF